MTRKVVLHSLHCNTAMRCFLDSLHCNTSMRCPTSQTIGTCSKTKIESHQKEQPTH